MDSFDYCFKGDRNYVHGSDIYNSIEAYVRKSFKSPVTDFDFAIHHVSYSNMSFKVLDHEPVQPQSTPAVVCKFRSEEEQKLLFLFDSDKKVECRYAYDEDSIVRSSRIDLGTKNIFVKNTTVYTPVEVVIALNKLLMQNIFKGEKGKWFFTRLMLKRMLPESSSAEFLITMTKNLSYRLTSSTIKIGDEYYGDIFFSLIKGEK
jgi:hypothetical protein